MSGADTTPNGDNGNSQLFLTLPHAVRGDSITLLSNLRRSINQLFHNESILSLVTELQEIF